MDLSSYYYDSYSPAITSADLGAAEAAAGGIFITTMIVMLVSILVAYAITSFLTSRIFKKAGVKTSIAWIPIYSTWKMLELGDQKGYWAPLMLVPFVNIASAIFYYIALYNIGKKLGKESWFIVLAIFAPVVWLAIMAFDKSTWNGGATAAPVSINTAPAYTPPAQDNIASEPVATEVAAPIVEAAPTESTTDSSNEQ
ncbi:MAG: DUF5684 domain-containing protein [Candidatus Saccharibacteria bacterium]